jgi:hypothetical protein
MQTQKMTPKDFAPHLVAVLGKLTEYMPGKSVPMAQTYGPVCEAMGIDEDSLGSSPNHTSKGTHRQIGLAQRQLRDHHLTEYTKKGHWALTRKGAAEAREAAGLPPLDDGAGTDASDLAAAARADGTAEDISESEGAEIVRLPVAGNTHPYSDDPYIRSLAIESLGCFGAHSSRSDTCKVCPVSTDCVGAVSARKGELAAQMEADEAAAKDAEATRLGAEGVKDASVDELIDKMNDDPDTKQRARTQGGKSGKFQPREDQDVAPAFAQRESQCNQCNEVIPEDDACMWVQDEGMFHNECVEAPTQ